MPVGQALSSIQSDGSLGWASFMDSSTGATVSAWYQGPNTPGATQTNGQWPIFAVIGQLRSGGVSAGNGMVTYRPDGSGSMTVGNKGVGLLDKNGSVIWSESETTFGGIKTPQLFIGGGSNTNAATWPGTNTAAWTTVWSAVAPINQPMIAWSAQAFAPSGVTGQFRITVNGTSVVSWSAASGFASSAASANVPAGLSWGQPYTINLDAQVTAGAGTVSASLYGLWGTATS